MTTPTQTIGDVMEALKEGKAYCVGCGQCCIPADESWKDFCSVCHFWGEEPRFCKHCGDPLGEGRRTAAMAKGYSIRNCVYCSQGMRPPCNVCGLRHPYDLKHVAAPAR